MANHNKELSKTPAWPKLNTQDSVRLREQLGSFCQETSFTAIVNIYRATNTIKRLAWFLTFLFCLGWLTMQCYLLLDRFFLYPSDVRMELNSMPVLDFPSVTVCNMNPIRSNALQTPPFDQMLGYQRNRYSENNPLYDAKRESFKQPHENMNPRDGGGGGESRHPEDSQPPEQLSTTASQPRFVTDTQQLHTENKQPSKQLPTSNPNQELVTDTREQEPENKLPSKQPSTTNWQTLLLTDTQQQETSTSGAIQKTSNQTTTSKNDSFEDSIKTDYNQWDILDHQEVDGFYTNKNSELDASYKYAYLSAQANESLAIEVGHSLKTFLINCKYGGYPCSPHNFTTSNNPTYGNCFTFNHPDKAASLTSTFPGPLFGLSLEFYLEQNEYIPALSPEAGVKVVVHPRNSMPFPVDDGISVSPGFATSIGLNAVEMIRLEPPHADCANKGLIEDLYMKNLNTNYSKLSCMKSCYQMLIIEECNCSEPFYYVENKANVCNMTNNTIAHCARNIKTSRKADYDACDDKCPQACYEQRYEKSISMAAWPSEAYEKQLTDRVKKTSSTLGNIKMFKAKEFVKLQVYYQELVFKRIENTKSYESMNLISDIGGQLGLWLGLSAITIGELISFLLMVCRGMYRNILPRKTTPVVKVKLDNMH